MKTINHRAWTVEMRFPKIITTKKKKTMSDLSHRISKRYLTSKLLKNLRATMVKYSLLILHQ